MAFACVFYDFATKLKSFLFTSQRKCHWPLISLCVEIKLPSNQRRLVKPLRKWFVTNRTAQSTQVRCLLWLNRACAVASNSFGQFIFVKSCFECKCLYVWKVARNKGLPICHFPFNSINFIWHLTLEFEKSVLVHCERTWTTIWLLMPECSGNLMNGFFVFVKI